MDNAKKFHLFEMRNFPPRVPPKPEDPALPPEVLDTEFKKKYSPDLHLGQELDDNARVWKVYRDEAIQHDDGMLQAWNNTINILLTFSGLFSAAVTAFVVESYQFLQTGVVVSGPDSSSLAVNDTVVVRSLSASPAQPSSIALFINGLWFTSLFLSLAAAFLCILVKQWLDEYTTRTRASSQNPRHWSRRRAFYFRALDDWAVAGIISVLPVLLHAALFLFFAGMVVLLSSLTRVLAVWLSVLAGALLMLYGIALCIPLWNSACPFATPLVTQVWRAWILTRICVLTSPTIGPLRISLRNHLSKSSRLLSSLLQRAGAASPSTEAPGDLYIHTDYTISPPSNALNGSRRCNVEGLRAQLGRSSFDQVLLLSSQRGAAESDSNDPEASFTDLLDCEALCWLVLFVSDSDATAVAFQSLGAVAPCSPLDTLLKERRILRTSMRNDWVLAGSADGSATESARIIRSTLALGGVVEQPLKGDSLSGVFGVGPHWGNLGYVLQNPHLRLLGGVLRFRVGEELDSFAYQEFRDALATLPWTKKGVQLLPSLHSTALLLATLKGITRQLVLLCLCFCQLKRITRTQWKRILRELRPASFLCLQHGSTTTSCDFRCILEGLTIGILDRDPKIDPVVVRTLIDGLPSRYEQSAADLQLHNSPTWISYLMSTAFQPRAHSYYTLIFLLRQLDLPSNWAQMGPPDIGWLKLWRRVAHLVRIQDAVDGFPLNLIASLLWDTSTTPPAPSHAVLQSVLSDEKRPSIWRMVSPDRYDGYPFLAEALAVALCAGSRSNQVECLAQLVEWFFAPIVAANMIWHMEQRAQPSYPAQEQQQHTDIHAIAHIMELRPSWWVRGFNRLGYNNEDERRIRNFALSVTMEVLRRGPCRDCLSVLPPDGFRIWVHDLDDARSCFLSSHDERGAALLELRANENDGEDTPWYLYDYGTLDDWKSDDEDEGSGD